MKIDIQKCKKLAFGVLGIYSFYFVGSILQQRIMKIPYQNSKTEDKQLFQSSNAFILIPSLISWIIGALYNNFITKKKQVNVPILNWIQSAIVILVGALAMTKAIYLTSFPLVTLFKSCSLLSVLTVGIFFSRVVEKNQKLEKKKMIIGFSITIGILLYHFGKSQKQQYSGNFFGIILLLLSIVCDGLLPDFQAQIKSKYSPTPMQMFQNMNKWKTYLCVIYSFYNYQIFYLYSFFINHPYCLMHMLALSITGAIGQMFVYWMINYFRQHVVPFVITTRKLLTVGISIIYFNHEVTFMQIIGIILVFGIICYDFLGQLKIEVVSSQKVVENTQLELKDEGNQLLKFSQKIQQINLEKPQIAKQFGFKNKEKIQKIENSSILLK